jgi:hypothetical protein
MAGPVVRETVTLAGQAEPTRAARTFVRYSAPGTRAEIWPSCWSAILFGNSVRHSGSGAPGETVAVRARDGIVRVEITDRAGGDRLATSRRVIRQVGVVGLL